MKSKHDGQRWLTVRNCSIAGVVVLTALCLSAVGRGQKGMGDETGIARSGVKPPVVPISGRLEEIRTHPCQNTTGRADLGTHLIIKADKNRGLNVHLGPAGEVANIVKRLSVGEKIRLLAFQTEKMPANHYVAKEIRLDGDAVQLRDSLLRPYWSGQGLLGPHRQRPDVSRGQAFRGGRGQRYGCGSCRRFRQRQRCRGGCGRPIRPSAYGYGRFGSGRCRRQDGRRLGRGMGR